MFYNILKTCLPRQSQTTTIEYMRGLIPGQHTAVLFQIYITSYRDAVYTLDW